MARMNDKYCDRCGYPTHRLYSAEDIGNDAICADCLLDELWDIRRDGDGVRRILDDAMDSEQ